MDAGGRRCLPTWMSESGGAHKELREPGSGESTVLQAQAGSKEASERKPAKNRSSKLVHSGCEEAKQAVKKHSRPMNEVKLESSFPTREVDVGLTVEDLVSIAEEYVNANKGEQHQHEANGEYTSALSQHPSGVLLHGAARSSPQISTCTTKIARNSSSAATDTVEDAPLSISGMGDAAQGMLDVLLGPLLRMPSDCHMKKELGKRT